MIRLLAVAACYFGLVCAGQARLRAEERAYPRSDLLIEAGQLSRPEFAAPFVILDARSRREYEHEHLPNACWVDHAAWAKAFGHGRDARGWGQRIGSMGVGAKTKVIVYDDMSSRDSARIWWILRYWGVDDVRLLNGGWKAWKEGNYPTETTEPPVSPVAFVAQPRPERLATKEQLLKSLGGGSVGGARQKLQIVDARSEREFCGLEKMRNKRAGAIPGAKQLEWIDLIDTSTQRFKSASALRQTFTSAGIALDRPTATHCQSGGRASVMAFGMELMGANGVSNYYPSWAEWSSAEDTPVVPGKPNPKN
jgi:thiosulfate/3-mercaptopyruvate sulfurtransferase